MSATTALTTSQEAATTATLAAGKAAQIEGQFWAGTIPILGAAAAANEAVAASGSAAAAGAAAAAGSAKGGTAALLGMGSATGKLDAALLGLRTAVGSTAVIGLSAVALAAIAAGKAFRAMIQETAALEAELNTFQATTGATAAQMTAVTDAARRLGADITLPAVSASDAAVAMTELAKAGLSVEDSIAGATGVLQLATAAQISNAEASQIAANALNAFGLAGDQAVRVADDFANAANAAQGSISDFGLALRQSSAVAKQVGLSLEDTISLLSLFAKNGLSGSDAGTSLRVALIRLVAPTKQANEEIKKLGLNIRDASGNVRADVFAQFGLATRNLTPAARDAAAALIFGQDAIRAVSIGAREGAEGLRLMQFQIDQQGTAAEVAGARTRGFAGSLAALQSNLQTLGTTIGPLFTVPLKAVTDELSLAASGITKLVEKANSVKIPPITTDVGFEVHFPGGGIGDFLKGAFGLGGQKELQFLIKTTFPPGELETRRKELNDLIQSLQEARISAEQAGRPALADEITAQIKVARQQLKGLQAEAAVGVRLKPEFAPFVAALTEARDDLRKVRDQRVSLHLDTSGVDAQLRDINAELARLNRIARGTADDGLKAVSGGFEQADAAARGFNFTIQATTTAAQAANAALQGLGQQANVLTMQQEQIQAGVLPGGRAAEEANIQAQIAVQQEIIDTAKVGSKKYRDALRAKAALMDELERLQAQDAADARDRASKAQAAAKKAADEAAKQTQAFVDQFEPGNTALERLIARAGLTSGLGDDIRFNRLLLRRYIAERKAIADRIRNMHLHGEALRIARAAIRALTGSIASTRLVIARLTADAAESARSARQTHLEAMLSIAETTKGTADDRRALNALIAFDKAQIARLTALAKKRKLTQAEKAELDAYRVDLAQRNQALRELTDETKKSKSDIQKLHEAEFAFLQTQQGFTANLIGNLIPGGLTSGLVGGAASAAATAAAGPRQVAGGFEQPRGPASAAVGPRPVSQGQGNTQIALLREIRNLLRKLNGGIEHPEAKNQRSTGAAAMDYSGGGGGPLAAL